MTINRRTLLMSAAAAGAAGAAGGTGAARADSQTETDAMTQAPAFHRMPVGDAVVTAIADGYLTLPAGAFPTTSEDTFRAALTAQFMDPAGYTAPVNAYVVQQGGRTILIDAGGSTGMAPTLGKLQANLSAAGIDPGSVETVLITHLHPDHIGGLTGDGGGAAFPNAELMVRAEEHAFWTDDSNASQLPESQRGMFQGVAALLANYEGRVARFDADGEVTGGIEAVFLPGHTPGHTGFRIASGDDALMIWGDIVHAAPVQLPDPSRFIGFDVMPETAIETRRRILERVARDRVMVAGMHMPFPGFGHLADAGGGYTFVRAPWRYEI